MARRALRVWARQQHRLILLIRARHPLLHRPTAGRLILETLGLRPRLGRTQRRRESVWETQAEDLGAVERSQLEHGIAEPVELETTTADPATGTGISHDAPAALRPDVSLPTAPLRPAAAAPPRAPERRPAGHPAEEASKSGPPVREPDEAPAALAEVPVRPAARGRAAGAEPTAPPARSRSGRDAAPVTPDTPHAPAPDEGASAGRAPAAPPVRTAPPTPHGHDALSSARPAPPEEPARRTQGTASSAPDGPVPAADAVPTDAMPARVTPVESKVAEPTDVERVASPAEEGPEPGPREPRIAATTAERLPAEVTDAPAPASQRVAEERQARRPAPRPAGTPHPAGAEPDRARTRRPAPKPEATPAPERPLFKSVENRSIAEWRRLLIEATTEPVPAPARPRPATAPGEPLLDSTRRFLRPLVGVDPATVRVHRGPAASRAAESAGADALAKGDDVVLPSRHDERTPEGLGLLAHELTHVARQREPRFIPPIARGEPGRRGGRAAAAERLTGPPPVTGDGEPAHDEESLARRVEGLVRAEARQAHRPGPEMVPPWTEPAFSSAPEPAAPGVAIAAPTPSDTVAAALGAPAPWGELPAPWEPLPTLGGGDGVSATAAAPAPVFRAGVERSVEEPSSGGSPGAAAPAPEAPAPDLDALARQVYDVLKRRLAADRRREG